MKKNTTLSPAEFRRAIEALCQDSEAELRRTLTLFRTRPTRALDLSAA